MDGIHGVFGIRSFSEGPPSLLSGAAEGLMGANSIVRCRADRILLQVDDKIEVRREPVRSFGYLHHQLGSE